MRLIKSHITPLVINSLRGKHTQMYVYVDAHMHAHIHTYTRTHTCTHSTHTLTSWTKALSRNQVCAGASGLKMISYGSLSYCLLLTNVAGKLF